MATTKLPLSIDPKVISKARRISHRRKTSVFAMFSHYSSAMEENDHGRTSLPPMTERSLELAAGTPKLPEDWDYCNELADILDERHGVQ